MAKSTLHKAHFETAAHVQHRSRIARQCSAVRTGAALDADLTSRYGIVQGQYDQYNSLSTMDGAVIAYSAAEAVGCGCFRRFDDRTAEIKRMFVRPANRGSGAANSILAELECWAIEAGFDLAILETGNLQPEAIRFYAKSGYSPIEPYGQYEGMEHSVCLAKTLVAT